MQNLIQPSNKRITILTATLLAAAALFLPAGCATHRSQAELQAKAKITQEQAQQIAMSKAPGGTIKEATLEKEHGKIVWSFDIAVPGARDITEVQVDADTGEVVSVESESPAQEAKEKKSR
jgi:hypothetical protein